jgi:aminopeptidase N
LAVLTNGYENHNTKQNFDELSGYTSPVYSFEVRQGAFQFLNEALGLTDQNLLDLMEATNHQVWQFKKYARGLLDNLLKDEIYKQRITALANKLLPEEKRYIESKLK